MLWWLVVGTLCATTAALRLHQHTSSPQQCVDLQCPTMSFDYGRKKLVNEETLSEEACRNCQQCTAAGYSVCLKPTVLNRAKRQASLQQMPTCSCAHSVPANCHNELSRTTHPANITMQLYNVCYASSLQAPVAPLAKNSKKNVIVTVEPFWEEPYWKELDLENLTLTYNYNVKVPEHCDGDLETKETDGDPIHTCTAQLKIGMSTEDRTGEEDYEHSENSVYDDELPPEVDFDRDVFAGAKTVNFSYKVSVRRPRQLKVRSGSSDPFEDTGMVIESETLIHDMKPELYGTGLEEVEGKEKQHLAKSEKEEDNEENEEKEEDKEKTHDDTPKEGEQEDEEAISEEEGEGPENLPGTDFFSDDKSKDKEMTDEEKKEEQEEQKEEEIEEKEAQEIGEEERKEEEKEEKEQIEHRGKEEHEEEEKEKSADEKTKEEDGEENKDKVEEPKETVKDEEKDEKSKEKEEDEKVLPGDDEEKKEEEKLMDEKEEKEEKDEDEEKKNEENGSGSDEGEDDEEGDETEEGKQWYQYVKDFFSTEPRLNLARWVFIVTIVACTLLICTVCLRRRCMARNKRHQKTANGVRYEAAATSSLSQTAADKHHGGHQLAKVRNAPMPWGSIRGFKESPLKQPLIDPEMEKEGIMETSIDELTYRYNSTTLSLKNLAANDLEICALIGRGRFGSIHRGMLHTERGGMRDVTVYWLQAPSALSSNEMKALVRGLELGVQSATSSTHISIHGISYNNEASLVVLDPLWEPDLRAVLRESRSARFASENLRSASFLSAERLFSIMKEISIGVKTLISKKVFHQSLCTANILVGERGHIKISGFGLAEHRSLTARKDEKTPRLIRWQSPRVLNLQTTESPRFEEADLVWSLGVLLWEIASLGGTPYAKIRNESELRVRIPNETAKIEHPSYVDLPLRQLIDDCLQVEATKRIDLESLIKRIECLTLEASKQLLLVLPFDSEPSSGTPRRTGSSNRAETFEYSPVVLPLE